MVGSLREVSEGVWEEKRGMRDWGLRNKGLRDRGLGDKGLRDEGIKVKDEGWSRCLCHSELLKFGIYGRAMTAAARHADRSLRREASPELRRPFSTIAIGTSG
jgi:hypothetical protein